MRYADKGHHFATDYDSKQKLHNRIYWFVFRHSSIILRGACARYCSIYTHVIITGTTS